jgi:hypothetical protein
LADQIALRRPRFPSSLVALALALAATQAFARPATIPGSDLHLVVDARGDLWIERHDLRARVPIELPYPDSLLSVAAKATPPTVTMKLEINCLGVQTVALTSARLEALLESAAAEPLLRAKRWGPAAGGFARALALDPTFSAAATNLAAAQAGGGHAAEATATLVAAAARDPVWVAWRIAADPDLAGVDPLPEIAKLYAPPAAGAPSPALDARHVAYSPSRRLFAWRRVLGNEMGGRRVDDELWIADVASGVVQARLGYGRDRRGATAIARTLAALGFSQTIAIHRLSEDESGTFVGVLPGDHLRISVDGATARVSRGGHVIGKARFVQPPGADGDSWFDPWVAPIDGAVILGAGVSIGDGCGAWSYDQVLRILIPPAD